MKKLQIEIFGKGCKNCQRLEENVVTASKSSNIEVEIIKIIEEAEIMDRGIFRTPGIAINGKVVSTGRVLTPDKIKELFEGIKS